MHKELLQETILDPELSLAKLRSALRELKEHDFSDNQSLGVSSNITLNSFESYLEKYGFINDADLTVKLGGYDDVMSDIEDFKVSNIENVLILWNFDNILPSFESQIVNMSDDLIAAKLEKVKLKLSAAFSEAKGFKSIYVADFHLTMGDGQDQKINQTLFAFNDMLNERVASHNNVKKISLSSLVNELGRKNVIDPRFYFMSKAPYKGKLLDRLAQKYSQLSRDFGRSYYKAVVLDCDNTLWGGVIGEDLIDGIALNPYDYPGNVFWRIQQEVLSLVKKGAIICLCSKNNSEDVREVLEKHPYCLLSPDDIVIQKVNWSEKAENIKEIASELNIGLDSIVFVDDSEFECSSVRGRLPSVKTIQVPKNISEYMGVFKNVLDLFPDAGSYDGAMTKTQQYKLRELSENEKNQYATQEDYLHSLGIEVTLGFDNTSNVNRIAELSQKSNQFNLTTRRYTPQEIESFITDQSALVADITVDDKFGSCGLTGVVIITKNETECLVDSFFMSCRILGRNIEMAIWPMIVDQIKSMGGHSLKANFYPTAKNTQVSKFYDELGLNLSQAGEDGSKYYNHSLKNINLLSIDWIKVKTNGS